MSTTSVGIKLSVSGDAEVKNALAGVDRSMGNIAKSTGSAMDALRAFAPVFAGAVSAGAFVKAADAVTTLNNQLRLATGSTQAATQAYNALFDIAQRSRVSFTELGSTFASISRAGQALGLSQERLLGVTEAIGNAMTISGGSAEGMKAALVQLGQGLASGTLRGEELNSVMEQTPRLAKALADGLGVSIGKLREMGAAGQLTGEQVIKALESQSQVLSGEVQGAVLTVGQAFTQLQNASIKAAGDMDRATGATSALASGLQGLSGVVQTVGEAFKNNEAAIQTTLGLVAGAAVAAGLARTATALGTVAGGVGAVSTSVTVLKGVVASLNPATLALLGLGAAVGYANSQAGNLDNLKAKLQELQAYGNAAGEFGQATPETKAQTAARLAEIERLKAAIKAYGEEAAQANFLAIGGNGERALREANAKAAASYDDLRVRLSGFKGDYEKYAADLARIQAGMASGDISQKQGIAWLTELALKHGEVGKAVKKAAEQTDTLTQARKRELEVGELRNKMVGEAAQAAAAAEADLASTEQALIDVARKSADSVAAKLQSLKDEETALAIAAEQNISLAQAIEEVEIARLREQQAALMREGDRDSEVLAIQSEIDARNKLKDAIGSKEARDASTKTAKEAADAWQKTAAKIEDSLTDALMRGFESGKDFAANLRDTVANMFKTLVLRPVVQATVQGGLNAVGLGNLGSASSGVGFLGQASNAYGMYSDLASGTIGASIFGGSVAYSSALGLSSAAAGSQAAMLAAQTGSFGAAGLAATAQAAGTASTAAASAASAASSAASSIAAAAPYLAAVLAVASIAKSTGGESRWGGQYGYNFGSGIVNNRRGTAVENAVLGVNRLEGANTFAEAEVQAAITGTVGSINALLKSAGSSAALVGFQAGLETSGKGRGGVFAGGKLSTGATFGESGQGDNYLGTLFETTSTQSPDSETALKNFTLDLQQVTIQALQAATDIPEALKKLVQGVDAENLTADAAASLLNTVQAQISAVEHLKTAFFSIGWDSLTQGAYDATVALAEASGGFDALSQNLVGYYQNFYTEAEQQARATETLTTQLAALGQSMPATRDGFRALVESAQAAGDTALLAGLLALQDEFAALVPAATTATTAVKTVAETISDTLRGLQDEGRDLQRDLLALQGGDLRAFDTAGYTEAELAAYDYNAALRSQITALQDAAASAQKAADAAQRATSAQYDYIQALDASRTDIRSTLNSARTDFGRAIADAQTYLGGLSRTVADWVAAKNAATGNPTANLSSARADFARQLTLAQSGNRDAIGSITQYADRLISAGEQRLGYVEGQRLIAQVKRDLLALPSQISAEQLIVDAIKTASSTADAATESLKQAVVSSITVDLANRLGEIDSDLSGQVSRDEFSSYFAGVASEATLDKLFTTIDTDGDGQLTNLEAIKANTNATALAVGLLGTSISGLQSGLLSSQEFADQVLALTTVPGTTGGSAYGPSAPVSTDTGGTLTTPSGNTSVWLSSGGAVALGDEIYSKTGMKFSLSELQKYVVDNQADPVKIYHAALLHGISAASLDAAMASYGWKSGDSNAWAKKLGLPAFAIGTNYVPRDMIAQIHEGEAIVPKAYNPAAGGYSDFGRGFEAMAAEIKALRSQVARLEAAANSSATSNALAADSLRSIHRDGVQVLGTGDAAAPAIKVEVITP